MDEDDSRREGKSQGRRKGNGIKSKKLVEILIGIRGYKEGRPRKTRKTRRPRKIRKLQTTRKQRMGRSMSMHSSRLSTPPNPTPKPYKTRHSPVLTRTSRSVKLEKITSKPS